MSDRRVEGVECYLCGAPATLVEDIVPLQRGWLSETRSAWWEHSDGSVCSEDGDA